MVVWIGVTAFLGAATVGCGKKVTRSECARLADKGADLKLDEDPQWQRLSLSRQSTYKAQARAMLEKSDSDIQQVNRCDPGELTFDEYTCAIKAKTFNEWGGCID